MAITFVQLTKNKILYEKVCSSYSFGQRGPVFMFGIHMPNLRQEGTQNRYTEKPDINLLINLSKRAAEVQTGAAFDFMCEPAFSPSWYRKHNPTAVRIHQRQHLHSCSDVSRGLSIAL